MRLQLRAGIEPPCGSRERQVVAAEFASFWRRVRARVQAFVPVPVSMSMPVSMPSVGVDAGADVGVAIDVAIVDCSRTAGCGMAFKAATRLCATAVGATAVGGTAEADAAGCS